MIKKWTLEEDRKLVALANDYRSASGKIIQWEKIPVGKFWRTPGATAQRWNDTVKHKVIEKDGKYALPGTLFDTAKPANTAAISVRPKVRKVKKSFLWGLYTVIREE